MEEDIVAVSIYEHGDFLLKGIRVEVESECSWEDEPPKREACPAVFRCFSCQRKLPEKEYGGSYRGKRFCRLCICHIDDFDAGRMIWRDRILGFENGVSHIHEKSDGERLPRFPHMSEEEANTILQKAGARDRAEVVEMTAWLWWLSGR